MQKVFQLIFLFFLQPKLTNWTLEGLFEEKLIQIFGFRIQVSHWGFSILGKSKKIQDLKIFDEIRNGWLVQPGKKGFSD